MFFFKVRLWLVFFLKKQNKKKNNRNAAFIHSHKEGLTAGSQAALYSQKMFFKNKNLFALKVQIKHRAGHKKSQTKVQP